MTNESDRPRQISVFTYCEFSNNWDTSQDGVNLQYSLFIIRGEQLPDGLLRITSQDNLPISTDPAQMDVRRGVWMGLAGVPVNAYDTARSEFLGAYRGYHNPLAVERGACSNSNAYGDNACGALQTDLLLQPGESRNLLALLGIGEARTLGAETFQKFGDLAQAESELAKLKAHWHAQLGGLVVHTPDEELNHTLNVWGLYNCLITFNWSRAASLVYNGERDGLGFRDSVQDVLGVLTALPEAARQRLELLLTGQTQAGGAMPVIRPFEHRPGHETPPAPEEYRSDDCLWFFDAVPAYVNETGDLSFYEKTLPYADGGADTVFGHLRRALEFNLERTGRSGLTCGLLADWNDCLKLGFHGESLFVAFQVYRGLGILAEIAARTNRPADQAWAEAQRAALLERIQARAWDGDRFIWAIGEDGTVYGTKAFDEGQIYLNTQLWAVISGAAKPEQAETCMETVQRELATPYGLMLCAPPFRKTSVEVMRAVVFNPGVKENAGIFNHTQGWGVMAECLLGHGDRAYQYLRAAMPAAYNDRAEIRQSEPYVQAQTTYSRYSPREGVARTSWLTGAAAWFYFSATQYALGIRPELDGLRLDPCIPAAWDGFEARRVFRGKMLEMRVHNPRHVQRGVGQLLLNGEALEDNLIPFARMKNENLVEAWLGE